MNKPIDLSIKILWKFLYYLFTHLATGTTLFMLIEYITFCKRSSTWIVLFEPVRSTVCTIAILQLRKPRSGIVN